MMLAAAALTLTCVAIDGDTIRCRSPERPPELIRLLAIDAPELRGHCRRNRICASGNPIASRQALAEGLRLGPVTLIRMGFDRYGRTLAQVKAGRIDLSCRQLQLGQAIAKPKWDTGGLVLRQCPGLARR